jgi:hypothetical protein
LTNRNRFSDTKTNAQTHEVNLTKRFQTLAAPAFWALLHRDKRKEAESVT